MIFNYPIQTSTHPCLFSSRSLSAKVPNRLAAAATDSNKANQGDIMTPMTPCPDVTYSSRTLSHPPHPPLMTIREHVQHVEQSRNSIPEPPFSQTSFFKCATLPRDRKWHISKKATLPRAAYQPHAKNDLGTHPKIWEDQTISKISPNLPKIFPVTSTSPPRVSLNSINTRNACGSQLSKVMNPLDFTSKCLHNLAVCSLRHGPNQGVSE